MVIESSVDQNISTSLIQPVTGIVEICKNSYKGLHNYMYKMYGIYSIEFRYFKHFHYNKTIFFLAPFVFNLVDYIVLQPFMSGSLIR